MYGTVYVTVHIDGLMMWYWPMMWHWLMRCHDPVGLKFLCTIYGDVATYHTWLFLTKPHHCSTGVNSCYCSPAWSNCVLLTDDVTQSWVSKLFLIRWSRFTQCIYKRGPPPPNWRSLNPYLDSIFCNSFSILYFLHMLINFYFAPSSIMSD